MKSSQKENTFIFDLLAGLTVSFAALSLGAAFGTMSGRGAFAGMVGAAIIPIITSAFGGTRLQASGPTAPMTAVSALVVAFAYENFPDKVYAEQFITLIFILNALMLILLGIFKIGRFIQYVPQVIILGFMNGIGLLIWYDQIKRLFGWGDKTQIAGSLTTNILIGLATLAAIYLLPFVLKKVGVPDRIRKFIPSMFVTIVLATVLTTIFKTDVEHVSLGNTIGSFSEFFQTISLYFPQDQGLFTFEVFKQAIPFALQLTLLAYLDSLLTSLVIDNMTKEKTKQDKELIAQGFANGASAILQGIPGAQATIRSVLLLKEGAKTRLAGILVGVFALLGFVVFNNYISMITSAVFVGVLFKAGLDVIDRDFIIAYLKYNWKLNKIRNIQLFFIVYSTVVTVIIDLNVAVVTGTIMFFIAKKYMGITDAEEDFANVESEEIYE
ncbi:MAG: SulP family inorganic anion transporter [Saprospiraceae bacterium]|nr:SulP family inorganic anion transporter [Saprospiraceae bacterium]MBK7522879.1 SulP family inorganic anion transporter [Saprospiraceae bacterium]MBK8370742.1 SulP family inorganic anion transporter [Saprospiraceae bacterium]MBK8546346.1 SulP family inorganic anion transporter [Saprospiraceae bacterium]